MPQPPSPSTARARSLCIGVLSQALFAGVALILGASTACSSHTHAPAGSSGNTTSAGDHPSAEGDASTDAGADALPDGAYRLGVYLCCGEGQGRSCCPPETLPDPAKGRSATCFQYGGVSGACVTAGDTLEAKDICSLCCTGLTRVPMLVPAENGPIKVGDASCEDDGPPSVFRCTACGDGTCGEGENECNCPDDCK